MPAWGVRNLGIASLKSKDLIGLPWMVAFALRADGWWLRSDIVWAKGVSFCPTWAGSVMPEGVRDRPTRSHEYLFLLTKAPRYFYDQEAVREEGFNDGRIVKAYGDAAKNHDNPNRTISGIASHDSLVNGRNLRSVWVINSQPYPGAHFATFPEALVEPCVRAGTSERGACPGCGAPWVRVVEIEQRDTGNNKSEHGRLAETWMAARPYERRTERITRTTGFRPSCGCTAASSPGPFSKGEGEHYQPVPCIVLDPFAGSGTTGMVAARLGRRFVGIDLAGGDKDLGGHTAHDRIRGAREGRGTEAAAFARVNGQTEIPLEEG